jgi:hypothetical protein
LLLTRCAAQSPKRKTRIILAMSQRRETMMSKSTTEDTITCADYFGGCPECGKTNGYVNVSRCHWFVCNQHKKRWCIGANLFSSWRYQTEAEQQELFAPVADYDVIEDPIPEGTWPRDPAARAEAVKRHREALVATREKEEAKRQAEDERIKDLAEYIAQAIAASSFALDDDTKVKLSIGRHNFVVTKAGVARDLEFDLPF